MDFGVQGSLKGQTPRWFDYVLHMGAGPDGKRYVVRQPMISKGYRYQVKDHHLDLIVVDSVAALTSAAELDAEAGDQFIGIQARMMSQNLKAIIPTLGLSKAALLFINQTRMQIGVMYGNPETTPGGKALLFYASKCKPSTASAPYRLR